MEDKGIPALGDQTGVSIRIQEVGGPTFTPTVYNLNREEDLPVDTVIITVRANDPTPDVSFIAGPSCSKLTMSLVNDSLKFKSSDMQIC